MKKQTAKRKRLQFEAVEGRESNSDWWRDTTLPVNLGAVVSVKPSRHVADRGIESMSSPAYLATVRKRRAKKIQEALLRLSDSAGDEYFAVFTEQILSETKNAIKWLTDAERESDDVREGNSLEIFRCIRDSLMNGGWENYRDQDVRQVVVDILLVLHEKDDIDEPDMRSAVEKMMDVKLEPALGIAIYEHEENGVID